MLASRIYIRHDIIDSFQRCLDGGVWSSFSRFNFSLKHINNYFYDLRENHFLLEILHNRVDFVMNIICYAKLYMLICEVITFNNKTSFNIIQWTKNQNCFHQYLHSIFARLFFTPWSYMHSLHLIFKWEEGTHI